MLARHASRRVAPFGETVFAVYTRLAREYDAVNLGQGFPDFAPPEVVTEVLCEVAEGYQQYAPLPGMRALCDAVAAKMGAALHRAIDPTANVQVTVGATEALFATMQALLDPGDEVVLIEPFYDAYPADVTMALGVPRYVPLHPQADGSWLWDERELRAAFSAKTKAVVLNTPHNPTGKVFSERELDTLVALAEEFDAIIVADEVYEHIAFEPHRRVAARPGGWERTLTISSIGKTFSVTGWKIGWAVGPEELIQALRLAHQWIPFAVATPLQRASARLLAYAEKSGYYSELAALYRRKRDLLIEALQGTPFRPLCPDGGYFVIADSRELGYTDDIALCNELPKRAGVVAIPPSAFYSPEHKALARHLVRFAYCKSDEAILEGGRRLRERL
jgi:aspartate/methionine/tyrosine aminotransferase